MKTKEKIIEALGNKKGCGKEFYDGISFVPLICGEIKLCGECSKKRRWKLKNERKKSCL